MAAGSVRGFLHFSLLSQNYKESVRVGPAGRGGLATGREGLQSCSTTCLSHLIMVVRLCWEDREADTNQTLSGWESHHVSQSSLSLCQFIRVETPHTTTARDAYTHSQHHLPTSLTTT